MNRTDLRISETLHPTRVYTPTEIWNALESFVSRFLYIPNPNEKFLYLISLCNTYLRPKHRKLYHVVFAGPPGSGKSQGLEIADMLSYRSVGMWVVASAASVFRVLGENDDVTLLLEEYNPAQNDDNTQGIRVLLLGMIDRNKPVPRQEKQEDGTFVTKQYYIFSGSFFTSKSPGTLADDVKERCFTIYMSGAPLNIIPERIDYETTPLEAAKIRSMLLQMRVEMLERWGDFRSNETNPTPGFLRWRDKYDYIHPVAKYFGVSERIAPALKEQMDDFIGHKQTSERAEVAFNLIQYLKQNHTEHLNVEEFLTLSSWSELPPKLQHIYSHLRALGCKIRAYVSSERIDGVHRSFRKTSITIPPNLVSILERSYQFDT